MVAGYPRQPKFDPKCPSSATCWIHAALGPGDMAMLRTDANPPSSSSTY
jgi:hypothetical protein